VIENLRNIAIIAHVDHGKTTLVDKLLSQSGTLARRDEGAERVMDSNDQEKERGITILAKNTAITWNDYRINIVDTPGHADFGGEVERVLSMVDCVLLLVDAVDGPMPQTRFVTQKAFAQGLKPIVVINKIDRPGSRPDWLDPEDMADDMTPLFEAIVEHVESPEVDTDGPFQMQVSALDYNSYLGVIGVGRIKRGSCKLNQQVKVIDRDGNERSGKILKIMGYHGLERVDVDNAQAGDIVCVTGIDKLNISDTLCDPAQVEALPALSVDEPTVSMTFQVNDSPFAGLDGKFVTSRNIKERLERELIHNVALRVEEGDSPEKFIVSGRGELHLSVLIESMRREGFELGVSRPEVIQKEVDGQLQEPFEEVMLDVEDQHQGAVIEELGKRKGDMTNMEVDGKGRVRLTFMIPSRGLIGFRSLFLTLTSGTGIMTSVFDHYGPVKEGEVVSRINGVLVSMVNGKALGYSLFNLQERGRLCIEPNIEVYEGMILGIHSRSNDLAVNPIKGKQLTNVRASGTDENIQLTPPVRFTLEQALDFIEDDELVEVTPHHIRLRKKFLKEHERKRAARGG
jgi:GTP-binding protein